MSTAPLRNELIKRVAQIMQCLAVALRMPRLQTEVRRFMYPSTLTKRLLRYSLRFS